MAWKMAGLVAVVLAAVVLASLVERARFPGRLDQERSRLRAARADDAYRPIDPASLPAPARRYREASGAARRGPVAAVHLHHGGAFRPDPKRPWGPIRGEQDFAAAPPGFAWWGRMPAGGLWFDALDRSLAGSGSMRVWAASIFPVVNSRGPLLDQGALLRLLGELVWAPTALFDARYLSWAPNDDTSARCTLRVGGREASGIFHFAADGLVSRFTAERYRDDGTRSELLPWHVACADPRPVDGLVVPFRCEVSWVVGGKPEPYARWEVEHISYE